MIDPLDWQLSDNPLIRAAREACMVDTMNSKSPEDDREAVRRYVKACLEAMNYPLLQGMEMNVDFFEGERMTFTAEELAK